MLAVILKVKIVDGIGKIYDGGVSDELKQKPKRSVH